MTYLFRKKKSGKRFSWYLGKNNWVDGSSKRVWEKYVGTAEAIKKMVENPSFPEEIESLSFGLHAAMLSINQHLKFSSTVDKHCRKKNQGLTVGEHILIDIVNRIDEQNSHNKLDRKSVCRERV